MFEITECHKGINEYQNIDTLNNLNQFKGTPVYINIPHIVVNILRKVTTN